MPQKPPPMPGSECRNEDTAVMMLWVGTRIRRMFTAASYDATAVIVLKRGMSLFWLFCSGVFVRLSLLLLLPLMYERNGIVVVPWGRSGWQYNVDHVRS